MEKTDQLRILFDKMGEKPIAFHRFYSQITGSISAGILLAQIVYWARSMNYKEFYKTDEDFCQEIGMNLYEFGHAKRNLETLGVVQITKRGVPAKSYYTLDIDKIINLVIDFPKKCLQTSYRKNPELVIGKTQNQPMEKPRTITDNNTDNNAENKEDNNSQLPGSIRNFLSTLSKEERESILDIFDFWNSYKGEPGWRSHTKLTFDMIKAIQENLKTYSVDQICIAIENYATVLTKPEYKWDYTWPLSIFLTVKYEKRKDSEKKWWKFLEENFIPKNYLRDDYIKPLTDPDPSLTKEIITMFKLLIDSPNYEITPARENKFIQTTIKMIEFFSKSLNHTTGNYRIPKSTWVEYLKDCIIQEHKNKGDTIYPGHLCSTNTWDTLMPQYLQELGCWWEK